MLATITVITGENIHTVKWGDTLYLSDVGESV